MLSHMNHGALEKHGTSGGRVLALALSAFVVRRVCHVAAVLALVAGVVADIAGVELDFDGWIRIYHQDFHVLGRPRPYTGEAEAKIEGAARGFRG